jgi:hypothetical protein
MRNVKTHVLQEQSPIPPLSSLQSSHQWVNIVLLVDGIRTLADIIIANPTQADLVSWSAFSHGVVMSLVVQMKERLYCDCYPEDVFLTLAIEVFGCLHQEAGNFLYQCANMV